MAEWLAYGLEQAFEDSDEFGAVRRVRAGSGLIHNEPREFDWLQNARETLAKEKADFIVMMIGLGDRRAIKERPAARASASGQPLSIQPNATGQPNIVAPENEKPGPAVTEEFRSERWTELYSKRVAEVMAVLKSKRVPVLWVGLPPIRGTKSRVDIAAMNDIFRAEAQKAGILYVDVWEGFLDESGDYSNYGPDVIGQPRRLRSNDGVFFTKPGARKLAHFVDREIKRLLNRETPLSLPLPEMPEKPPEDLTGPAPRPVAGPVVPLTGAPMTAEGLLGGPTAAPRDPNGIAVKVLVNGEPPPAAPGRADNFVWPPPQAVATDATVAPPQDASAGPARQSVPATTQRPRPRATRPGSAASATSPAPLNISPPASRRATDEQSASAPTRPVR
jgi:hypothetical protein